jgi:hypothetical protein
MHADDLRRGALLMLASGLLFSAMGALVKHMSAQLPNEMVVFFDPRHPWRGPSRAR